jgi:hypothetical protein
MRKSGVSCFLVAKVITADLNGSAENTSPSGRVQSASCPPGLKLIYEGVATDSQI